MVFASILSSLNNNNVRQFYVNSVSGDDNNNDGTISFPFQTISGAHTYYDTNIGISDEIVILNLEGTFELLTYFYFKNNWTYAGNGPTTRIKVDQINEVANTTFRKLIFDYGCTSTGDQRSNFLFFQKTPNGILNLQNVVFTNYNTGSLPTYIYSLVNSPGIIVNTATINIFNCTFYNTFFDNIENSSNNVVVNVNIRNSAQSNSDATFHCSLDSYDGIDDLTHTTSFNSDHFFIKNSTDNSTKGVYSGYYPWTLQFYLNSETGNDSYDGTILSPFKTIQGAHNYYDSCINIIDEIVICNLQGTFELFSVVTTPYAFIFKNNWTYAGSGIGTIIKANQIISVYNNTFRKLIYDLCCTESSISRNLPYIFRQYTQNAILNLENVAIINFNYTISDGTYMLYRVSPAYGYRGTPTATINIFNCMFYNTLLNSIGETFDQYQYVDTVINIRNSAQSNSDAIFDCSLDSYDGIDDVTTEPPNYLLIPHPRPTKGVYSGYHSWTLPPYYLINARYLNRYFLSHPSNDYTDKLISWSHYNPSSTSFQLVGNSTYNIVNQEYYTYYFDGYILSPVSITRHFGITSDDDSYLWIIPGDWKWSTIDPSDGEGVSWIEQNISGARLVCSHPDNHPESGTFREGNTGDYTFQPDQLYTILVKFSEKTLGQSLYISIHDSTLLGHAKDFPDSNYFPDIIGSDYIQYI